MKNWFTFNNKNNICKKVLKMADSEVERSNTVYIANASDSCIWAVCDTRSHYVMKCSKEVKEEMININLSYLQKRNMPLNVILTGFTRISSGNYLTFRPGSFATNHISIYQEDKDESLISICSVFPVAPDHGVIFGTDNVLHNTLHGSIWKDESKKDHSTKLKIHHAINETHYFIKGNNGKYVCSENGQGPMKCNRPHRLDWERFEIIECGNGKIALKNMKKYVSSENGNGPMTCNRSSVGPWEMFEKIENSDGSFSLKGNNRKYVCSENGSSPMTCNRTRIDAWEKFYLH